MPIVIELKTQFVMNILIKNKNHDPCFHIQLFPRTQAKSFIGRHNEIYTSKWIRDFE